jgi:high-affinity Fe2+/Pb2+ permease
MFSNDQNIETIGQLVETLKHYVGLQGEYIKLDFVEKTVKILTVIAMTAILSFLLILVLIYTSFAVAYALEPLAGRVGAFAIVAGAYLVVLLLFIAFRKRWIERPLVKFLASLLLSK